MDQVFWSDGHVTNIPYYDFLGECKNCNKFFELSEAESIDFGDHLDSKQTKTDFRLKRTSLRKYYRALKEQSWTQEQEFFIRERILTLENNKYRFSVNRGDRGCLIFCLFLLLAMSFVLFYNAGILAFLYFLFLFALC